MNFVIRNCKIAVSYYCFTLVAAAFVMDIIDEMVVCMFAALIHEIGHMIPLIAFSGKLPRTIAITPFGINIISNGEFNTNTFEKIIISLSGPVVNILTFTVVFLINDKKMNTFAVQNLILGVFNLLPILPLDGGCILSELLYLKFDLEKADMIVEIVSFVFILPLFYIGFIMILNNPYNYFMLFISFYLVFLFVMRKI